jgi:hypothetical protein
MTLRVKHSENWRRVPFSKRTDLWWAFRWSICDKFSKLLGVSGATVSKVMSTYMNLWKTTSGKRNSGRKSTLTEGDRRILRRIVSKNHRNIAAQVRAELSIYLEDPVSIKTVWRELHKSSIHGKTSIAKPLITESNIQLCRRWCHDHKTWTYDNWKRMRDMVRWTILHTVPYIRKGLRLEKPQGSL